MNKNTKTISLVFLVVVAMTALAFASVPLYRLFCQVTGFGGTTQVSESAPDKSEILDRTITINFNSDTNRNLNWFFKPEKRQVNIKVGQQGFISFKAINKEKQEITGTAIYNVTPPKAGQYFHKTQCFCFGEQTLKPGEETDMPVVFYIDPKIAQDRNMDDVKTITLSYSFFKAESPELEKALDKVLKGL